MGSWQVEAKNGSGQLAPKEFGPWDVKTSFPLGLFGNPKQTNKYPFQNIGDQFETGWEELPELIVLWQKKVMMIRMPQKRIV